MATNFPIPKGFSLPEGVKDNEEFSEIATFKTDGGKVHLLTIGEKKTPITDKEEVMDKPKGAKQAIKEQLAALEDKSGSDAMEEQKEGE